MDLFPFNIPDRPDPMARAAPTIRKRLCLNPVALCKAHADRFGRPHARSKARSDFGAAQRRIQGFTLAFGLLV